MRTTNKCFKEQVQQHILDIIDEDCGSIEAVSQAYQEEFNFPNNQKRYPNHQDRFQEWLKGLPTALNIEYEYYTVNETLKQWFEACGAKYTGEPGDKAFSLYLHLVTREFRAMGGKL